MTQPNSGIFKSLMVGILAVGLSACGQTLPIQLGQGEDPVGANPPELENELHPRLAGVWETPCFGIIIHALPDVIQDEIRSGRQGIEFTSATTATGWVNLYSDENCENAIAGGEAAGLLMMRPWADAQAGTEIYELDAPIIEANVVAYRAELALLASVINLFQYSTWNVDQMRSILGRQIVSGGPVLVEEGRPFYSLLDMTEADNGTLRFGELTDDLDGSSAEKRPTQIEPNIVFERP